MGISAWILVGLIAGALGKLLMPGDDPGDINVTILLGIVGAFVGGCRQPPGGSWGHLL